ncbi:hypothetical protein [Streptacidiphilus sp. PB12-B1b]|uniref:hypothetical protein n=1 Tax=Streptacidiphilus sp. PB12-B1b TaxID=2705012 RepID=UPI003519EFB2
MFGRSASQEEPVVVIRDTAQVTAALRSALETADAGERAGLERALRIAEQTSALSDAQVRRSWVRDILDRAGADPVADDAQAVKALRTVAPGLSLTAAYQLVKDAAENPA